MQLASTTRQPGHIDKIAILLFSIMLAVPLFRPYFIESRQILLLYGVFMLGASAYALRMLQIYASRFVLLDYLIHAFFIVFAFFAALGTATPPWGKSLLLVFLYLCYMFGKWVGRNNGIKYVIVVCGIIYIPISVYVSWQLAQNNFSYNTYIRWSSASFKLSYLDYALYGVLLFLFLQEARVSLKFKLPMSLFLFTTIATSGARYSIIFLIMAIAFGLLRSFGRRSDRDNLAVVAFILITSLAMLHLSGNLSGSADAFTYTTDRLTSMVSGDRSIGSRIDTIRRSIGAITASPLIGYGMGNGSNLVGVNYPHNILLEVCLEAGIIPGLLMLAILGTASVMALYAIRNGQAAAGIAALYLMGAYLKSFSFYEARVLFFFVGVIVGVYSARTIQNRSLHRAGTGLRSNIVSPSGHASPRVMQ